MIYKRVLKRRAKILSYNKRYLRLTTNDAIEINKIKKLLVLLRIKLRRIPDDVQKRDPLRFIKILRLKYLMTATVIDRGSSYSPPKQKTIDKFTDSQCRQYFRFEKAEDLDRLFKVLKFPDYVILRGGNKMLAEIAFLRGLFELSKGESQVSASEVFGGDQPLQSKAFSFFVEHIFDNFHHLLDDNLDWWFRNCFFHASAEAIGRKMGVDNNRVAHFIDCNCLPTSRVGGGPAESGANSARWDQTIQEAFYNGWKSIHGLKHQTVDNAFGCTVDMCGPTSLRVQ